MATHDSSEATKSATLAKNRGAAIIESEQASALAFFRASGFIEQTHGFLLIEAGAASDHAAMRADQLCGLLMLMRVDECRNFRNISNHHQESVLWLAEQLADELRATLPHVVNEAFAGAKA